MRAFTGTLTVAIFARALAAVAYGETCGIAVKLSASERFDAPFDQGKTREATV